MTNKRILTLLALLIAVAVISGCSLLPTLRSVKQEVPAPSMDLPANDSLLAKHIPTQVLLKTTDKEALARVLKDFNGQITGEVKRLNVYKITISTDVKGSLVDSIKTIRQYAKIDYAEPVYVYEALEGLSDSEYARQWGMKAIGLEEGLALATNQGEGITIAVVDSGVDYLHPELNERVVPGYDVYSGNSDLDSTMDFFGHGTHVAGIAAANVNAGAVTGVAPKALIMPVKVIDDNGGGTDFTLAQGVIWAVDNGARVINLSLGGKAYSQTTQDAIDYAINKNVPVIVSMGNTRKREVMYPAACPGVIAVGAVDGDLKVARFSTRGRHISVAAPGVDIYSTLPQGEYGNMSGTSMAAPFVTGAVALLLGQEPDLTINDIKSRIEASAVDVDAPGFDENTGYGVINLSNLLSQTTENVYGTIKAYVELSDSGMPGVDILVKDALGNTVKNLRTNDDGVAYINTIKMGTYTVRASLGDKKMIQTDVQVKAGEVTNVNFIQDVPTSIGGYVTISRGGTAIENAQLTIINEATNTTYNAITNSGGSFYLEVPAGSYKLISTRAGYAGSIFQSVAVKEGHMTLVNMIQQAPFSKLYTINPPTISFNDLAKNDTLSGEAIFTVNAVGDNAIKEMDIRFGHENAMPDIAVTDKGSAIVKFDTTAKPNGANYVDVIVYDINNNVAHITVPVVINNEPVGDPLPDKPAITSAVALTFGEDLGLFKYKRAEIFRKMGIKENPNLVKANGKTYNIQSAPADATIYVSLRWMGAPYAMGYKVYRSKFSSGPFTLIADVNATEYVDCSGELTPGQKVYYKVAAYNATGIGSASPIVYTEPMEPFRVSLVSPEHNAQNVSLNPTFIWDYTPIESDTKTFSLSFRGVTDDDYTRMVDVRGDVNSYDYAGESLLPGKEYEWDIYTAYATNSYSDVATAISFPAQGDGAANGTFSFTTDPDAVPPTRVEIMNETISVSASVTDWIPLEIKDEARYEISTSKANTDCDTILYLYDETGALIAENDDFEKQYSLISKELTPGQYYIVIKGYDDQWVDCILKVHKLVY